MFTVELAPSFIRDLKKFKRRHGGVKRVYEVIDMLRKGDVLPLSLEDHQLLGKLRPYRELHIAHDWLLMYERDGKKLRIVCIWLTTHKKLRERERTL